MPPYVVLTSIPVPGCTVFPVTVARRQGSVAWKAFPWPWVTGCWGPPGRRGLGLELTALKSFCPPSAHPINRSEQLEGRACQRGLGEGRRFAETIESWVLVFVLPQTSVILGRSVSSPGSQLAHQSSEDVRPKSVLQDLSHEVMGRKQSEKPA